MSNPDVIFKDAEKKMNSFSLFGGSSKYEAAADMFNKAGNLYKNDKNWEKAGDAYAMAAENFGRVGSQYDSATNSINAAQCYKKIDLTKAIVQYEAGIRVYIAQGKFSMVAKLYQEIAEMYGDDNKESAKEFYQKASDAYENDNQTSRANTCLLKFAEIASQLESYEEAIEAFKKVSTRALENNLLKYSAKDYLLKCGICYLANSDSIGAQQAFAEFCEMDPSFETSREGKFLNQLITSSTEFNVDAYVDIDADNDVDADVDADANNDAEENNEVDADSFGNGDAYADADEDPNIEPYVEGGDEPAGEVDDDGLITIKVPAAYIKKYISNADDDAEEVNDDGIVLDFDEQKS